MSGKTVEFPVRLQDVTGALNDSEGTRAMLQACIWELSLVLDDCAGSIPKPAQLSDRQCQLCHFRKLQPWLPTITPLCVHCIFSYDAFLGLASCKVDYSLGLTTNMWWIPCYTLIQEPGPLMRFQEGPWPPVLNSRGLGLKWNKRLYEEEKVLGISETASSLWRGP